MGAEITNVVVGQRGVHGAPREFRPHVDLPGGRRARGAPVQIVTGAQNVHEGDLVPVAKHNSYPARRRPHHQGQAPGRGLRRYALLLKELGLTQQRLCPTPMRTASGSCS